MQRPDCAKLLAAGTIQRAIEGPRSGCAEGRTLPEGADVAAVGQESVAPDGDPGKVDTVPGRRTMRRYATFMLVKAPVKEPAPKLTFTVTSPFTLVAPAGVATVPVAPPFPR